MDGWDTREEFVVVPDLHSFLILPFTHLVLMFLLLLLLLLFIMYPSAIEDVDDTSPFMPLVPPSDVQPLYPLNRDVCDILQSVST